MMKKLRLLSGAALIALISGSAALAHYDTPGTTPGQAQKTSIVIDDIRINGDVLTSSFFSEGEKLEYEFHFEVFYKNHTDFQETKTPFKLESQYNVSFWWPLYMVETHQPQGNPFLTALPQSERLIGEHIECAPRENIAVFARGIEMDLSTNEKIIIGIVGLIPSGVAEMVGAPAYIVATLFGVDVIQAVLGAIGDNDDLGVNHVELPLNGTATVQIRGAHGGADITLSSKTERDPANDDKCATPVSSSGTGISTGDEAAFIDYSPLENTGGTEGVLYALAFEPGWRTPLPPKWGGIHYESIGKNFASLAEGYVSAATAKPEQPASPERLASIRSIQASLALDSARLATALMLEQATGMKGAGTAQKKYGEATVMAKSDPPAAFPLYESAYEAAYIALHEGQTEAGQDAPPLEIIPLPGKAAVEKGGALEVLVTVTGLPQDTSGAQLSIASKTPFKIEAKRKRGVGNHVLLRIDAKDVAPGDYTITLKTGTGQQSATASLGINVFGE